MAVMEAFCFLRFGGAFGTLVARGSWLVVRGSWLVVRGSWFVARGSWLVVRGSWFVGAVPTGGPL